MVIGKGENQIRFVVFSEEKQQFLEKCYTYASPEIGVGLHSGHSYRVTFGDKPQYPVIEETIEEGSLSAVSLPSSPS